MGIASQRLENEPSTSSPNVNSDKKFEFPVMDTPQVEIRKKNWLQEVGAALSTVTVEPAVFLIAMGFMFQAVIGQSLLIRKFCLISMNLTEEQCSHLQTNKTLETQLDKMTSVFGVAKIFVETIPAMTFALFAGSWCDKNGRKKAMLLPSIGGMLTMLLLIINANWMTEIPPVVLLFSSLPLSSTGGLMGILIFSTSYLTDFVSEEKLTFRMGLMHISFLLATPIGLILGGILFASLGYVLVFLISFCLYAISFLYTLIRIEETVKIETNSRNCCSNFFDIQNVKDGLQTILKKRENNHRFHLFLFMIISVINMFPVIGEMTVAFLYTRNKFNWAESTYSFYMATTLTAMALGLMIGIPLLTRVFKCSDATLGIIASGTKIASDFMIGFSTDTWMMFASCLLVIFNGVVSPVTRSIVSKCTSPHERAKIYSMLGACESLAPALGGPLYAAVFNSTLSTFPGAVYLMSGSFYIIPMVLFRFLLYDMNKFETKDETEELAEEKVVPIYGSTNGDAS